MPGTRPGMTSHLTNSLPINTTGVLCESVVARTRKPFYS